MGQKLLRVGLLLCASPVLLPIACSSNGSSGTSGMGNSGMNLAGTWTVTAVSTQGGGTVSGTANVQQSGTGPGTNGVTTLTAAVGSINLTQSGTTLSGTITDSLKGTNYSFIGTLSGSALTITGSASCSVRGTQSVSIKGTIGSTNMQGSYTITRSSDCYYPSDAGTWIAAKQ